MGNRLVGKAAFITGGASGLGAATAELFVKEGATIVIADLNDRAGAAMVEKLGSAASYLHLDVTDEDSWRKNIDAAAARLGRLDVLVNSAGIPGGFQTIEEVPLATWNKVMAVNLTGTFLGCQNAVRVMKNFGNGGSIINLSSVVGLKAWAPLVTYGTGKAAVAHLSKSVALHCGKSGSNIRCNSVHPGTFDTPILDEQLPNFGNDRDKMLEKLGTLQVLGRVGQPWELAAAIVFLASDDSAFITATEFVVDGGFKEI